MSQPSAYDIALETERHAESQLSLKDYEIRTEASIAALVYFKDNPKLDRLRQLIAEHAELQAARSVAYRRTTELMRSDTEAAKQHAACLEATDVH